MSKKSDFLSKKIGHCQRDSYKEDVKESYFEGNGGFYVLNSSFRGERIEPKNPLALCFLDSSLCSEGQAGYSEGQAGYSEGQAGYSEGQYVFIH